MENVATSCSCVQASGLPLDVEPGATGVLQVRFDPEEDPDFREVLAVELTGYDRDGGIAFRAHVQAAPSSGPDLVGVVVGAIE